MSIYDLITGNKKPQQFQAVQIGEDGNPYIATLNAPQETYETNALKNNPRVVLSNAILGKREMPVSVVDAPEMSKDANGNDVIKVSAIEQPEIRRGGLINDLKEGFNDNLNNGLNVRNLTNNTMADGRPKNLINRFGEGLGTLGRIIDNPLGRGLIAYGLSNALGDTNPLEQGITATVSNQQNRMKDRMYRNELEKMGFDTSGIIGYVGDDTFNKIYQSKQLQDNAEYRNALLESQRNNQEVMRQQRQAELDYKRNRDAKEDYYKGQQIAQGWAKINQDKKQNTDNVKNLQAIQGQLQRFEQTFDSMPNKLESNTLGRLRNATGFQTKQEANFNTQRTLLFNKIARDLGGEKGVLSDQDIKRIEDGMPRYTDSKAQKIAKMQAIWQLLYDRIGVETGNTVETNNDPLGIR